MKDVGIFVVLFLFITITFAQNNLVPNGDLELHSQGNFIGSFGIIVNNWYNPNDGSPDFFYTDNTNMLLSVPKNYVGFEDDSNGSAYGGIVLFSNSDEFQNSNTREYIQTKLIDKLSSGKTYYVSFYISPTFIDETNNNIPFLYSYNFGTDDIGAYFSKDKITDFGGGQTNSLLNYSPQIYNTNGNYLTDTSKWYKIEGCYTATGGEEWITIGNFKDDTHTSLALICHYPNTPNNDSIVYIYIDDVSVIEMGNIHNVNNDTLVCENQVFIKELIAQSGGNHYLWNTGDTTQTILVNQIGIYWYEMELECGKVSDTIYIKAITIPEMNLGNDISQCENGQEITLNASQGFTHYLWNTGDTTENITILQSGIYFVTGTHICGIKADTVQVINYPIPNPPEVKDTFYCQNEVVLPLQAIGDNLLWYNGLNDILGDTISPIANTESSGISYYYVTQTENNCESEKAKIEVKINALPSFILPNRYDICENESIEIGVILQENCKYLWNTNDTTPTIKVNKADIYELSATNTCGIFSQETEVKEYTCDLCIIITNAFTPNLDGSNDVFFPVIRCPIIDYTFIIFDRWGRKIVETHDITFQWNGTNKGQNVPEGVYAYRIFFTNPLNNSSQNIGGSITLIR